MKICVDENIPLITVAELGSLGHGVLDIRGTANQGMPDDLLWKLAQKESRLLISTDKGFVQHRNESYHGILIVRLRQSNEQKIHERVMKAMGQFAEDEWPGLIVVMRNEGLLKRGKCKMNVICAVMRKLVHVAYGVLKTGKPFDPEWAKSA